MKLIGYEEIHALRQMLAAGDAASMEQALADLERQTRIVRFPYTYNAKVTAIATAATSTVNVQIDAAAPFLIVNQTFEADLAGVAQTSGALIFPNVTVLLTDTASNRQMMDVAVPITSIFGNGQFPYILPEPKLMPANSVLSVAFTSFEAAATPTIRLSFNGYKLYQLGN